MIEERFSADNCANCPYLFMHNYHNSKFDSENNITFFGELNKAYQEYKRVFDSIKHFIIDFVKDEFVHIGFSMGFKDGVLEIQLIKSTPYSDDYYKEAYEVIKLVEHYYGKFDSIEWDDDICVLKYTFKDEQYFITKKQ